MSKIHMGDNPNTNKAKVYLTASIILAIPVALYFFAFVVYRFHFSGIAHLLPIIVFGMPSSIMFKKYKILQTGLKGESDTVNILKSLDESYTVFNNLHISVEGKETEIDNVVIGNNGIFIVEVKNHNGTIEGNGNDDIWVQHKIGRKGGAYTKEFKNPIKQVKYQTFMLSKYLKANNINVWIEDMVYFSNNEADSRVFDAEKVFFNPYDVLIYIQQYVPRKQVSQNEIDSIIKRLEN